MGTSEAPPCEWDGLEPTSSIITLRASPRELYSQIFSNLPYAVFATDEQGGVVFFNPEAERLLGRRLLDTASGLGPLMKGVLPDGITPVPADQNPVLRALVGEEVSEFEQFVCPQESVRGPLVSVTSRPLRDLVGTITGAVITLRELAVSETRGALERANEELRRSQEQRAELWTLLVHDLKSPLQSILMNARFLARMAARGEGEGERDCLKDVLSAAEILERMVLDLQDVSVSEETQLRLNRTVVEVPALLREVRDSMAARAADQRQHLVLGACGDDLQLYADRELLFRMLVNLIDNAIKYGPIGGTIGIEARSLPDAIELRVWDEGPGVPEAQRARVFDKYTRVAADANVVRAGSRGLGLRFCWVAAAAHEGQIWVEEHEPQGARFCARIPHASRE